MPSDRYDDDRPPRARRYDEGDDRPPPKTGGMGKVLFIVFGIIGVVVLLAGVGLFYAIMRVKEAAGRMQVSNNMKQLNLAAFNYDSANGMMPGPSVDPPAGFPPLSNPGDRMSWRVNLLPYIEQVTVYSQLDFSQAWDSPRNRAHTSKALKTFGDPNDPQDADTRFRCFYDNGAVFDTDPKKRVSLNSPVGIPDGTSNTILFVETTERVPWAQFNEMAYSPTAPLPQLGHPSRDVFLVAMGDGSVKPIRKTVSEATLRAAITRAGNDAIGSDW
jgi:hypothetical protein